MVDNSDFEWETANENKSENNRIVPKRDSSILADTLNTLIQEGDFQAVKDFLKEKALILLMLTPSIDILPSS